MPDVVPQEQLAKASGIKIFMDMGSAAAAVIVTGILLGSKAQYSGLVMALIIGIMLISAATTIFGTPGTTLHAARTSILGNKCSIIPH